MTPEEIKTLFDNQAPDYDTKWERTAPIKDALLFLLLSVFSKLPVNARILCVGLGTGDEMFYLAKHYPEYTFVAIDPSNVMIELCKKKAEINGIISRIEFHVGYIDTLPIINEDTKFHAATCFLVSQFILNINERIEFFKSISNRLLIDGILASSDLASDINSLEYNELLPVWFTMMSGAGVTGPALEQMRIAYGKDVAVLQPNEIVSIIKASGFNNPVQFYQAGLIHAWFSKKKSD